MKKQSLGIMISSLRKEKGMTQLELAEKMGVTDKAVSKWERDLSCPDVNTLPKLAETFGISVDELMQVKTQSKTPEGRKNYPKLMTMTFKALALAMGVAVTVTSILNELDTPTGMQMLGIGLACLAMSSFLEKEAKEAASFQE